MIPDVGLHYEILFLSALLASLLSLVWYYPTVFGFVRRQSKSRVIPIISFIGLFIAWGISGYVLSHVLVYVAASGVGEAIQTGFWIWLGFVVPFLFGLSLVEGKSYQVTAVHASYYLIGLLIQASLISGWGLH